MVRLVVPGLSYAGAAVAITTTLHQYSITTAKRHPSGIKLGDVADSKSAGLRPLGVRLPLPAPPAKAAPDAGSSHIDLGKTDGIQTPPEWSCDRVVTETGAIRRTGRQSGLESLDSAEGDERYG